MKLAVGTAQFGMVNYGISNQLGRPKQDEVFDILKTAKEYDIKILDTAYLYGISEEIIGESLNFEHNFKIVTKTPHFNVSVITENGIKKLDETFSQSLKKLKQESIYALLVHNADDLLANGGQLILEKMQEFKQSGKVEKIGVSVYDKDQIDRILDIYNIDIIQLPINVLDQRLLADDYLKKIKNKGIEIHARSVFLQGLLLMDLSEIPEYFTPILPLLSKYHALLKANGIALQESALNFVKNIDEIDYILVGIASNQQLIENIKAYNSNIVIDYSEFACSDPNMLNPSKWRLECKN